MEDLLTPLTTVITRREKLPEQHLTEIGYPQQNTPSSHRAIDSKEDALKALQSKPDLDLLVRVLRFLDISTVNNDGFNIKVPGPAAAQLIYILVSDTVPHYWALLADPSHAKEQHLLLRCLKSVSGIGAIIAHLRLCLDAITGSKPDDNLGKGATSRTVKDLLSVLETLLRKDNLICIIWKDISVLNSKPAHRNLVWKEFISFVGGGRILSLAAEAQQLLRQQASEIENASWLSSGDEYLTWIGQNVIHMLTDSKAGEPGGLEPLAQILGKALSLGYSDILVGTICSTLMHGQDHLIAKISSLIQHLSKHDQLSFFHSMLRVLSKQPQFLAMDKGNNAELQEQKRAVSAGAAIISGLLQDSVVLRDGLMNWIIGVSGDGFAHNIRMHRSAIAALSRDHDRMQATLTSSLDLFADKLFIKHAPLMHQEVNTQVFLIVAGYIHRSDPVKLAKLAGSSAYLNAISNRLSASLPRSTILGMIAGTAISELVDPKESRMNFDSEDVRSADAQWYRSLTRVQDSIGSISDTKAATPVSKKKNLKSEGENKNIKPPKTTAHPPSSSKVISIEVIGSSSVSEEDDLPIYAKPDSDASDSDEDPTLVRRDKPSAPVYIRDLVSGLRDTENHDRHKLALATASSLIRRKTGFGTEVSDNLEQIATLLVGLDDKYEMERFQEMRLQALIALLVAKPAEMGPWFSRTYFNGDYSISQRATILTVIGLGARELAGFAKEDAALTGAPILLADQQQQSFPSKKLPEKFHQIYSPIESPSSLSSPMTTLSQTLQTSLLQPLALKTADRLSGPDVLKVRTFSSRMAVEAKRTKPRPNALAKVLAEAFFLPLTGLWQVYLRTYGSSSSSSPLSTPPLLPLFIRTLSILLHASGPTTLSLPSLTTEFFSLLLSLRPLALADPTILESLLFGLLTLLTTNAGSRRRVAEENTQQVLETREWVGGVMRGGVAGGGAAGGGGGGATQDKCRMLGAGVLVELEEIIKEWQRVMVGEMGGFL